MVLSTTSKSFLVLILAYIVLNYFAPRRNNVCRNFAGYLYPEGNENCYYDPDASLETPELIKKYAGEVEIHEIISEDGYISTMFRIPRQNSRGVILIHHSIATYSHIYLFQGNDSLALTLWRYGYDVWLANQRGTYYSDRHLNMTKYDYKFWDFSFHEMGYYDIAAELELIREKTNNSKVIYLGHSLGATMGLVYASLKPREARNYIKDMILLSPATTFSYRSVVSNAVKFFLVLLKNFTDYFQIGSPLLYLRYLLSSSKVITRIFPPTIGLVILFVWLFCGFTPDETDMTFFHYDAFIFLNNFSWKTIYHYGSYDEFTMYDYGTERNLMVYGNVTPPLYPLENILVPTLIVSSSSDSLILQKDCDEIFMRFSQKASVHGHWKYSGINHLDFQIGLHRKEIFIDRLIDFLIKN